MSSGLTNHDLVRAIVTFKRRLALFDSAGSIAVLIDDPGTCAVARQEHPPLLETNSLICRGIASAVYTAPAVWLNAIEREFGSLTSHATAEQRMYLDNLFDSFWSKTVPVPNSAIGITIVLSSSSVREGAQRCVRSILSAAHIVRDEAVAGELSVRAHGEHPTQIPFIVSFETTGTTSFPATFVKISTDGSPDPVRVLVPNPSRVFFETLKVVPHQGASSMPAIWVPVTTLYHIWRTIGYDRVDPFSTETVRTDLERTYTHTELASMTQWLGERDRFETTKLALDASAWLHETYFRTAEVRRGQTRGGIPRFGPWFPAWPRERTVYDVLARFGDALGDSDLDGIR
ncbi:hypothetical protein JCM11491_003934 [Sporobolomyces phaffii]